MGWDGWERKTFFFFANFPAIFEIVKGGGASVHFSLHRLKVNLSVQSYILTMQHVYQEQEGVPSKTNSVKPWQWLTKTEDTYVLCASHYFRTIDDTELFFPLLLCVYLPVYVQLV